MNAAAQIIALLCVIWLAAGATALVGMLTFGVAVYIASTLHTRRRKVLIVGGARFCCTVEAAARGHRRLIASRVMPDCDEATPFPAATRGHDVVVEGRILNDLRPELTAALVAGGRVLVVPNGMSGEHVFEEPLFFVDRIIKRGIDIVLALGLLALTLPVLLVAMVAIKLESKGPVFFVRTRVGLGGRPFSFYKLRTMRPAEDEDLEFLRAVVLCAAPSSETGVFKPAHTARITRVGAILRRYSIDELPQIMNVLKGDMSIVGPRPPLLHEIDVYDDVCMQRLRVKPGITGLAQISGRSSLEFDRIVRMDLEYCERWSPLLELKILGRTPIVVLTARGAG